MICQDILLITISKLPCNDTDFFLEQNDSIKYLGVLIGDKLNWKKHISFISSRISRNAGVFFKLRHYLSPTQLRQLYYTLIYPYLSYAITAWGTSTKTNRLKLYKPSKTMQIGSSSLLHCTIKTQTAPFHISIFLIS